MKKIIKAVFTLSFFSVIDRALGFVFKIYLSRELGAAAMGVYQVALSIFFVLLTLTSSGIPLVVSKLTAKYRLNNDKKAEGGITTAALIIGIAVSVVVALVIFLFRNQFGKIFASPLSMVLVVLLLPGLIFSSIYSAFRGNLWGKQKYVTVSIVELIEQLVRIALCILLFALGFDKIKMTAVSMSLACAVSAIACLLAFFVSKGRLKNPKGYIVPLIKSSAPITLSRAATSLVGSITAIAVPFLLISSGMSSENAMYVFGYSVGMAFPLLYIPLTIVGSLAFVMIPALSASAETQDKKGLNRQIENSISFSIIVASLFLPFFAMLGKDIGIFVYNNADSGQFLAISAWLLIPLAVENITSSMMNSLDLEIKSFVNYCIGSVVMYIIIFCFYKNFTIELLSISMGVSLVISSILDILAIKKKTGIGFRFLLTLLECVIICAVACFLTKWTYNLTEGLHVLLRLAISGVVSVVFMILLYFVFDIVDIDMFKSKRKKKGGKTTDVKIEKTAVPDSIQSAAHDNIKTAASGSK